jgi:hypothetical protein
MNPHFPMQVQTKHVYTFDTSAWGGGEGGDGRDKEDGTPSPPFPSHP